MDYEQRSAGGMWPPKVDPALEKINSPAKTDWTAAFAFWLACLALGLVIGLAFSFFLG